MRPILLACLLALPAQADPAADFKRLTETFPTLGFDYSAESQITQAKTFVSGMTGKWVQLGAVLQDGAGFPDDELFAQACERHAFTAQPTGSFGFDLSLPGRTVPDVLHLQWMGGTTFASQYDEAGLLERVFGDKNREMPADVVYSTLTKRTWVGNLILLKAGEDLIYVQAPQAPADVLARCPA